MSDSKSDYLKNIHEIEVEILDEFVKICNKNRLTYYLIGGTLLGAIRHKGFIPWDDDLDIAMPRKDFRKFGKIISAQLGKNYYYQTSKKSDGYYKIFSKIRKNGTTFIEEENSSIKMHHGIFIDIFPLDSGKKDKKRLFRYRLSKVFSNVIFLRKEHKKIRFKYLLFYLIPMRLLVCFRDKLLSAKGDYYLNFGSQYGIEKQCYPKDYFDPPLELIFEGKKYSVPRKYEMIMRRLYGDDYMEIPPANKRITHKPLLVSFEKQYLNYEEYKDEQNN